jgi:hypothetical protein
VATVLGQVLPLQDICESRLSPRTRGFRDRDVRSDAWYPSMHQAIEERVAFANHGRGRIFSGGTVR